MKEGEEIKNEVTRKVSYNYTVAIQNNNSPIDVLVLQFTEINRWYSDKKQDPSFGIYNYYSLEGLIALINAQGMIGSKNKGTAILKGIYSGGTSGRYCKESAPYLFLDVDVKEAENSKLRDSSTNAAVFNIIKDLSVFAFRSFSKKGFAACIYVPELANLGPSDNLEHLGLGNAITSKISELILEETGIHVKFDSAQNKFRQIRNIAPQETIIGINLCPPIFKITKTEKIQTSTHTGVPMFTKTISSTSRYSIEHQYNQNTDVSEIIRDYHVGGDRYRLPGTSSSTSGFVDRSNNIFVNFSSSYSPYTIHTPFWLTANLNYNGDAVEFKKALIKQGYKDLAASQKDWDSALKELHESSITDERLYEICNEFSILDVEQKYAFIDRLKVGADRLAKILVYLKAADLKIEYDQTIEIDRYVSECFKDILDYSDQNSRLCIKAETGTGKTSAILREFKSLRPSSRCLIIEPLTSIVNQLGYQYEGVACLTGSSNQYEFDSVRNASIVVSTMEQAVQLLKFFHFDYVFIDEFHGLITSNRYKRGVISELTMALEKRPELKVIGMTGTPLQVFKHLEYHLLLVCTRDQKPIKVVERHSNLDSYKILLQHYMEFKGRAIFRLNDKEKLRTFKKQLIAEKHLNEDEVLILEASYHVKNSDQFQDLLMKESFGEHVKIVLTTSMIDEGVSIKQFGFTSAVFIEDSTFAPRPEAVKQFFARFRNTDQHRVNYFYRKTMKTSPRYNSMSQEYIKLMESNEVYQARNQKFKGLYNSEEFFYNDGSINLFYTAFEATENYFQRLSAFELRRFLEHNYNLAVEVDYGYTAIPQSAEYLKESKAEYNKRLYELWQNDREDILSFVRETTLDKALKLELDEYTFPVREEILPFFSNHFRALEGYSRHFILLERMGLRHELFFLDKERLRGMQALNNQMSIAVNLNLYFSTDPLEKQASSDHLKKFVNHFSAMKEFAYKDVQMKVHEVNPSAKTYEVILIGFLKIFMDLTYDKRKKRYKVKGLHDLDWVLTHFFYIEKTKLIYYPLKPDQDPDLSQLHLF
jgi:hypothetical protein